MPIVEALRDPVMRQIYLTAFLAGLAVVVMCGVLSVLVVVKRLGFVGQGVSHSAFGGIGVAAVIGALGLAPDGGLVQLGIVLAFCIAAALGMAAVSDRRRLSLDAAIGLFLVGSMAAGAILVQEARGIAERAGRSASVQSWESILFGSIITADGRDAAVAWAVAGVVVVGAWVVRRPMLFWCLDEETARAFGVPTGAMKVVLMVLLSLAVVVAMKLTGVVLATALLVLPGATALRLSARLWPVLGISVVCGIIGLVGGLCLSLAMNWQPGPAVVVVLTGVFVLGAGVGRLSSRRGHTAGRLTDAV